MSSGKSDSTETQIAKAIPDLAERGFSKQQAVERLTAWFGDEYDSIVANSVHSSPLRWNKSVSEPRVSDALIQAAVHYAVAIDHEAQPDLVGGLTLPDDVFANIAGTYDLDEARAVLGLIAAGLRIIEDDPSTSLSKGRYDTLRDSFIDRRGDVSSRGRVVWPPTSQTVTKRLGENGWNDAMTRLGLSANEVHEGLGRPTYSPDEYKTAIRLFLQRSGPSDGLDRFTDYDGWATEEREAGRAWPSSASVKSAYGSWNEAIRALGESSKVNRVTERRKRALDESPAPHGDALDRLVRRQERRVSQIEDTLDELNALPSPTPEEVTRRDALLVQDELQREQLEALRRQKTDALINDRRATRQFGINATLAGGTLLAGVATVAVPVFQHMHWWPFLP